MKEMYVTPKMIIVTMEDADIITASTPACGSEGSQTGENHEF